MTEEHDSRVDESIEKIFPYHNMPALVGYYFGIFSLIPILGLPLGIVAIILGIIGKRKLSEIPDVGGKVHANIALYCGLIATVLWAGILIAVFASIESEPGWVKWDKKVNAIHTGSEEKEVEAIFGKPVSEDKGPFKDFKENDSGLHCKNDNSLRRCVYGTPEGKDDMLTESYRLTVYYDSDNRVCSFSSKYHGPLN